MKLKFMSLGILCAICCCLTAAAQDTPASAGAQATQSAKLVLKEGTDVKLKFADALTSKTAVEGDPVNLLLDEDMKVGLRLSSRLVPKPSAPSPTQKKPA